MTKRNRADCAYDEFTVPDAKRATPQEFPQSLATEIDDYFGSAYGPGEAARVIAIYYDDATVLLSRDRGSDDVALRIDGFDSPVVAVNTHPFGDTHVSAFRDAPHHSRRMVVHSGE